MPKKLSNWLTTYAEHTSISEAPKTFHFWTGVSVIAGALRRRVWIDQKIFQWTPNFYIVLVAPPGVATKSTAMKVGYKFLRKVPGIKFGPQSLTWQGLLRDLSDSCVGVNVEAGNGKEKGKIEKSQIKSKEELDNYLKGEALAKRTYMSCLTCDVSELGTFLRPKDADLQDFLTDMWDGQLGTWKRVLATQDSQKIENPWLNVIGCTTPSWLRENFTTSMIFGGLTSRCIFVWGNEKVDLIPYPGDIVQDELYKQQEKDLLEDLIRISNLFGEMKLTPEAKQWGRAWYEQHWTNRPEHLASDRFSGYLARKQTHIHKLAMVLSAAVSDNLTITKEHLELSDLTITSMERDMVIVFDYISDSEVSKHIDEIISIVGRNKTIEKRTLWRHCIRLMDEQQFVSSITAAVNAGYLTVTNNKGKVNISIKKDVTK